MAKFYILDSRGVVGNCALWWVIDGKGYTCDLAQAWLVDETEARRVEASRGTDIAVPEELAKRHAFTHVRLDSLRADMEIPYRQPKPKRRARAVSCICPASCDCEAPDAEVARCSNLCPEHNFYPLVDDRCKAREHRNGGARRQDEEAR